MANMFFKKFLPAGQLVLFLEKSVTKETGDFFDEKLTIFYNNKGL